MGKNLIQLNRPFLPFDETPSEVQQQHNG